MLEGIRVEALLVEGGVFIVVYLLVLRLVDKFSTELNLRALAQVGLEIYGSLEILLYDILLLLGEFLQRERVVENHCRTLVGGGERLAGVAEVEGKVL